MEAETTQAFFYLYSALSQCFAAIVGVVAVFLVLRYQILLRQKEAVGEGLGESIAMLRIEGKYVSPTISSGHQAQYREYARWFLGFDIRGPMYLDVVTVCGETLAAKVEETALRMETLVAEIEQLKESERAGGYHSGALNAKAKRHSEISDKFQELSRFFSTFQEQRADYEEACIALHDFKPFAVKTLLAPSILMLGYTLMLAVQPKLNDIVMEWATGIIPVLAAAVCLAFVIYWAAGTFGAHVRPDDAQLDKGRFRRFLKPLKKAGSEAIAWLRAVDWEGIATKIADAVERGWVWAKPRLKKASATIRDRLKKALASSSQDD